MIFDALFDIPTTKFDISFEGEKINIDLNDGNGINVNEWRFSKNSSAHFVGFCFLSSFCK
jgi:hypothetical protein